MGIIAQRHGYSCLKNRIGIAAGRQFRGAAIFALTLYAASVPAAHAADLVGATAGELGVSPAGSASYSIPIAVPPGTTGLQPKITIQYDSLAGNGPAGMGWSVGGLATITRCPTSINIDGTGAGAPGVDPVDYDGNDKVCLNGERLVPVVGAYLQSGTEYRTYQEEFSKIISNGQQGQGPQSFKVWRKSGEILEFGFTTDSRIEALAPNAPNVWVWALNKLSDTYGNYETFSYTEDTVNGGFRISRIDYTGNAGQGLSPYNHIDFIYASRSDDLKTYQAGSKISLDQRLTNIKVYADATLFRNYQITYETTPGLSGRSRPVSVKECATNLTSGGLDCFPPTIFQWSPDGTATLTSLQVTNGGITGSSWDNYNVVATGDFNGDGRTDIYVAKTDEYGQKVFSAYDHVWLSDGNGGFADVKQSEPCEECIGGVRSTGLPQYFVAAGTGDFNGDGLTDFYAYKSDQDLQSTGSNTDFVHLSNGDGTFTETTLASGNHSFAGHKVLASGDFNGDGLTDLFLARTNGNTSVIYNDGTSGFVLLGTATGSLQRVVAAGITMSSFGGYAIPATGDFTGDGITDMYVIHSDKKLRKSGSNSTYHDHLWIAKWTPNGSSGTLTFQDQEQTTATSLDDDYGIAGSGDFNGDGLTDFYVMKMDSNGRKHNSGTDSIWLATGKSGFEPGSTGAPSLPDEWRVTGIGDFDGDGLTDL
jgi:hypothetical protein